MANIRKLEAEEISQIANGKIFTADIFQDIKSMASRRENFFTKSLNLTAK